MARHGWLIARALTVVLLASACMREPESVPIAAHEPQAPTPVAASDVKLELSAATRVDVGDDLAIELRVRNQSNQPVTLVRPIYGSWELARHPRYDLMWTDEQGSPILDPLGFAPGLECGTLDPITADDLVTVEPGATAALANGPGARTNHEVLASARPGRYSLRVRYLAQGLAGATDLQILSDPITVEIVGGDLEMWSCRAEQVVAAADHEWVSVSPIGLLPSEGGSWLLVSNYHHRVINHETKHAGEVWTQRLGNDLRPLGDRHMLLRVEEELGWVSVAARENGATLVATPGSVGARRIEARSFGFDDGWPTAGEAKLVQAGPGNPYVTRVVARGDRVAILHHGSDADEGALMLSFVNRSGTPLGPARELAAMATDFELLAVGSDELAAVWLTRGDFEGGVLQRLDASGEPLGPEVRFALDPSYSIAAAQLDIPVVDPDSKNPALALAWIDSSVSGQDRADMMGIYTGRFSAVDGKPLAKPRPLSFESRTEARFGDVAWHGEHVGVAELHGATLDFGIGALRSARLSSTADGRVELLAVPDGFVALWTDHKSDGSRTCVTLHDCVAEVHGARFNPEGGTRAVARQLTALARAKPFVPPASDWQKYCQ